MRAAGRVCAPAGVAALAVIAIATGATAAAPDALRQAMLQWPVPTADMLSQVSECDSVVVGGGWSGVYAAYRLAAASPEKASDVCLFEASHRLGGRTLSVPIEGTEFTLDLGAYRFTPDMHLPGDVILNVLKLPTKCYEPDCPKASEEFPKPFMFNYTAPLQIIIDPETQLPRGYGSAINQLAMEAQSLGVKIYTQTRLADLVPSSSGSSATLSFKGPGNESLTASPSVTMLNLPRQHMLSLPSLEAAMPKRSQEILKCIAFEVPPGLGPIDTEALKPTSALSKAYLYYGDAWWRTKLSLTTGQYPNNGFWPMTTSKGIRLLMHWNDGAVSCSTPESCHGFLQVYYSVSNETFYSSIPTDLNNPEGILKRSDADGRSSQMLDMLHAAVIEAVQPILKDAGISEAELPLPDILAVGVWRRPDEKHPLAQGYQYTAPTKVYWSSEISGTPATACNITGLTEEEYMASILQPFGQDVPVYLANNDYCIQDFKYMYGDWAEDSLRQAERALHRMGLPRPDWLDKEYYLQRIEAVESRVVRHMKLPSPRLASNLKRSTHIRAVEEV